MRSLFPLLAVLLFFSCEEEKRPPLIDDTAVDSTALLIRKLNVEEKRFRLDTLFARKHREGGFNGAVLVAQEGIVIYKKAFGISDTRTKDSLRTNSVFQLASVSKQFTAAAVMLLHQQGKLNYGDTLGKFFPGFPYGNVTVKQLLTHRSGLANYVYFCDEFYREKGETPATLCNADVVAFMQAHKPAPYYKPGTKFDYCNTNYCLLAALVEKISKQTFAQFMKANFFQPLQMSRTWIAGDTGRHEGLTKAYYGAWKEWQGNYLDGVTGDKGVYSTVEDLFKWDQALYSGYPLSARTLEEAFTPASPERSGAKNYGYGWRTIEWPGGGRSVFHNGWWHGYTSVFYRGIHNRTTIIILCNKYNRGIYNVIPLIGILQGDTTSLGNLDEQETETGK